MNDRLKRIQQDAAIDCIVEGYLSDADVFGEDPTWADCENYWSEWAHHHDLDHADRDLIDKVEARFRFFMKERARVALSQMAIALASSPEAGCEWADQRVWDYVDQLQQTLADEQV